MKGEGGVARVTIELQEKRDISFDGLDFGICIVGISYTKTFILRNLGNVTAEFDMESPSPSLLLDVPRDVNDGRVRIGPSKFITAEISYKPEAKETLACDLEIFIPFNSSLIIPIKASAGRCDWSVDPDFGFINMHVEAIQTQSISISNIGDLPFPVKVSLTPGNLSEIMTIDVNKKECGIKSEFTMGEGQVSIMTITVTPNRDKMVEGMITLETDHGAGPKKIAIPLSFRIFAKQVAVNNMEDVSVGRILVGEEALVQRTLTNYGSEDIFYKNAIIPGRKDGNGPSFIAPEENAWIIRGEESGILYKDSTLEIEVAFESKSSIGQEWVEAYLLVQESADNVTFSELCRIQLQGGCGVPKISIQQTILEFGDSSVSGRQPIDPKKLGFRISSVGNARASYEIQDTWNLPEVFAFASDPSKLTGVLNPDDHADVEFTFTPSMVVNYETSIYVKTQLDEFVIQMTGFGAEYVIQKSSLPEEIIMDQALFGDLNSYQVD